MQSQHYNPKPYENNLDQKRWWKITEVRISISRPSFEKNALLCQTLVSFESSVPIILRINDHNEYF